MGNCADPIDLSPQNFLTKAISGHDVQVEDDKGWITIKGGPVKVQGEFVDIKDSPQGYTVQFDFRASNFVQNKVIIESNAGFGATLDEAKKDAYSSFLSGSFHTLLAGLIDHKCEQVETEVITINGIARTIYEGGVQIKSSKKEDDKSKLISWYDLFRDSLIKSKLSNEPHWVRIYVAQFNNEVIAKECLLDNEPWEYGAKWIDSYDWPKQAEFYSVRYFVMIK